MRKYTLASPDAKNKVDLRDYADVITEAVLKVSPDAVVKVERNFYTVDPPLTQSQAIKAGRQICQSNLKRYCIQMPKLFTSIPVSNKKAKETENEERK